MWFGGGWMILWMLLSWAGVILVVVWGVRAASGEGRVPGRFDRSNALQIVEERLARGEIDRDEFEERRSILKSS